MTAATPTHRLAADWFDGRQARPRRVSLTVVGRELILETDAGEQHRHPRDRVAWPEPQRHGQLQILLPDGTVAHVDDGAAWKVWADAHALRRPWAARWAASWRWAAAACALLVGLMAGVGRWGVPAGAQALAALAPESLTQRIDRSVIGDLEGRGWLKPSRLPQAAQQELQQAVARMVQAAYPAADAPRHALRLGAMPRWMGPNAFALPGGQIVVSDALVQLMSTPDAAVHPAVLGVVAHELGHVRERHGLRLLLEASATGALLGWWIGDYSSILAGAPALMLQAAYSRGHESAADHEALRVMRAAGIDPRAMVQFFQALKKAVPERDGDSPVFGLSSHPADSQRIRFFEEASR